jgi:hypothetical protein
MLISNDHYLLNPHLRILEDFIDLNFLSFCNILKVDFHDEGGTETETVTEVLSGIHNANGLAKGPNGTILLGDASGGALQIITPQSDGSLAITSRIQLHTTIDNPHYYHDNLSSTSSSSSSKSSYFLAGLTRGIDLSKQSRDPEFINPWIVHRVIQDKSINGGWRKEVVLEDDGRWFGGGTKAVFIPDKDKGMEGKGWLINTGIYAIGLGVVKIKLS